MRLRQTVVEFDGFALGDFDQGLDSLLSEGHQFVRREAPAESLGFCEADAVDVEALAVGKMDSRDAQHAGQLILVTAFVVVIAEDSDDRNVNMFEHGKHAVHLLRHAVIGKVTGNHERIGKVVDWKKLVDIAFMILPGRRRTPSWQRAQVSRERFCSDTGELGSLCDLIM